jgi:hypothetical protein
MLSLGKAARRRFAFPAFLPLHDVEHAKRKPTLLLKLSGSFLLR